MKKLSLCLLLAACSDGGGGVAGEVLDGLPEADLAADPAIAEDWSSASAPNTLFFGMAPIQAADLALQLNEGSTCPQKLEEGDTTTYTGGCTDPGGNAWVGTATMRQVMTATTSDVTITYRGFGQNQPTACSSQQLTETQSFDGGMTYGGTMATGITFTVDLKFVGESTPDDNPCLLEPADGGVSYQGRAIIGDVDVDGDGDTDEITWSGSGTYGSIRGGKANVRTDAELINDVTCEDEAMSGTTRVSAGGHEIVYTYDGATDCDPESTVTWTFDGVDQGELAGVSCSAGGNGAGTAGMIFVALALASRRARRKQARHRGDRDGDRRDRGARRVALRP